MAVPERLGIVGGGYIGLELGSVWRRLGAQVTVIEMLPEIAATLDGQVRRTAAGHSEKAGLRLQAWGPGSRAPRPVPQRTGNGCVADGEEETLEFDKLLVSTWQKALHPGARTGGRPGSRPTRKPGVSTVDARLRTSVPTIYAIGDLVPGPMLAHKASAEGTAAAETIAGKAAEVNYDAIPAIVYTAPEVAGVGMTEEQVKERGDPLCHVGVYPFSRRRAGPLPG
jgi:dihydrolipoamide dehydrogenase